MTGMNDLCQLPSINRVIQKDIMAEHRGGSDDFAETLRKHLKRVNWAGSIVEVSLLITVKKLQKPIRKVARMATAADVSLNNLTF